MFQTKIILFLSLLVILGSTQQLYAITLENHVATVQWEQASYPVKNNKAKVIINEPDMNKYPQSIDRFNIQVFSDSDNKGITVRATETSVNSGIFESTIILTYDPSKETRLHIIDGDTLTAKYIDTTLPKDQTVKELQINGTAFVGSRGPPVERAPASNLQVYNTKGNPIDEISLDQQIEIATNLQNSQDKTQKFTYLVQIQNEKGETVLLSWIDGILDPLQTLTPSISWIPNISGLYTATVFVWEDINNPTALSPPISLDLKITSKQFDAEKFNKEQFVKLDLIDYKYSYDSKKHIDFIIKLEGYYPKYYAPQVSIKDDTGKTVWDNLEIVGELHGGKISPTDFNKQYDINEIGGPIQLNPGKYVLIVKFENWHMERDLFVN